MICVPSSVEIETLVNNDDKVKNKLTRINIYF